MTDALTFDYRRVRTDFPILATEVRGKPLTYLDNAATSQKPLAVIEALDRYYRAENSNIHRGVHYLSEQATDAYEATRAKAAAFVGAADQDEIIFTRGTTEGINLIAHGFTESVLQAGDEILITHLEHHANIVPWQIAAQKTGAILKVVPVDDRGVLDMEAFEALLSEKTKLVSVVHVSNALGTINPVKEIIAQAHALGVPVLVDGAQSTPHMPVSVADLGCDFFVLSGHKICGPTGIGVLWGKREWLEKLPPYQSGGDMIEKVDFDGTTYKGIPGKFEAGTPHIAGVIGLGAAFDYLTGLDRQGALAHELALLEAATEQLSAIDGLRIIGTAPEKASVISFLIDDIHPHDIGTFLDAGGVAIRAGHHCTQPLLKRFGVPATARASFAFYNDFEDVERLVAALTKMKQFFC
ncbi:MULTISPECIES: cysteine desulfurase [unclassified Lentimonas]|uniref:cysteine desulfurase n=1 Tax=unclassified Lentimonas TaxID=2630993 RepID=UPI00132B2B20|nr:MULTISPECIES: cysteine desulfurase [unclassified Lentimonas]CAA6679195.1 Cysteine desulfurase (EC, SufS subfamily [Lentimonas sp. CC4]CAA6684061.1 Cysteine desulfurase (EC, SufS subfamily [Lentimonas sp. CC6]CAA7076563.1 Cysteine desulfurase (EC, SufS subfamily [Lentimonas sp. CC4]CAA7171663.1 Cysteine desulfurase (EC, SufS subfamily [Lentimonas sp. CC21]CAA7183040.1 Cysteine desulfurase (EC, SufS subfamily [Lentimonas sp. CC8]